MSPEDFRDWRKSHGMTQAEVARLMGVTPTAVYFWESGRRPISKRTEASMPSVLTSIQVERRLATERRRKAVPWDDGCILGPGPDGQYHPFIKRETYVHPRELGAERYRIVEFQAYDMWSPQDPLPEWPDKYGDHETIGLRIRAHAAERWPGYRKYIESLVWVIFADRSIKGFAPGDAPVLPAAPVVDGVPLWPVGQRAWHGFSYLRPIADPRRPVPRPRVIDPPPAWGQALDGEALRKSKKISVNSD